MIQVFSSHFGCIFAYFISFCFCVKMELQLQTKFSLNWIIEMQHFGNRIANVHHVHIIWMGKFLLTFDMTMKMKKVQNIS